MNKSSRNQSRQRALNFEQNTSRQCIADSEREKCKTLLTQMLLEVIRLTFQQEHGDE